MAPVETPTSAVGKPNQPPHEDDMTIDNHSRDHQFGGCSASHAEAHSRIALEQSALFAAQLAISRWASAGAAGQPAPVMAQAHWYAQAQQNLQQWLVRGGFAQDEDGCSDLIKPTMYSIGTLPAQPSSSDIPSAAG